MTTVPIEGHWYLFSRYHASFNFIGNLCVRRVFLALGGREGCCPLWSGEWLGFDGQAGWLAQV